jgi:hypothetical protein
LRNATGLWDAIAGKDDAALRRALPQHQAAKGKELFRLAREHQARRVTEKLVGGRLELIAPPDEGPSQCGGTSFGGLLAKATARRPVGTCGHGHLSG